MFEYIYFGQNGPQSHVMLMLLVLYSAFLIGIDRFSIVYVVSDVVPCSCYFVPDYFLLAIKKTQYAHYRIALVTLLSLLFVFSRIIDSTNLSFVYALF